MLLEGVALPATRDELVAYAALQDARAAVELGELPERAYRSIDEVGELLARTQPAPPAAALLPRPESGEPPGGPDYTNPSPESGAVRAGGPPDNPASQQIDAQAQTLQRQQAQQEA